MQYDITDRADGTRKVELHRKPRSAGGYICVSKPGGKPMNLGINQAKRVARSADKRDRLLALKGLGAGMPKQALHHQELVQRRHGYYHQQHDEFIRERSRAS